MKIPVGLIYGVAQRLFMGRLDVRVTCHEAVLQQPYVAPAFFINVTNNSPQRSVRPTHVTVLTRPQVAIVNPLRPFRKLEADGDSWETWVEKGQLPDPTQDIRALVQVRFSTGTKIMAEPVTPGPDLPLAGPVPS